MCSAVCFTSKSELPGAQGFIAGQVKHRELCFGDGVGEGGGAHRIQVTQIGRAEFPGG